MGEEKKTPVQIDDKEYILEEMTSEQQAMINHLTDLDRKIRSSQFNTEQLQVGRNAFMSMLTSSLASE
jgi:hypothetical protein